MLKFKQKLLEAEKQIDKPKRVELKTKESIIDLTEEIKPFDKSIKPIINRSLKQQFNDDSNHALYGLIQLLIDKEVITNDDYLTYCVQGITIANKSNKGKENKTNR